MSVRPHFVNTRLKEQAPALSNLLLARGAAVFEFPLVSIFAQVSELSREFFDEMCRPGNWLVFTSGMGAQFVCERIVEFGLSPENRASLSIAAIGEQTAKVISSFGLHVTFTPQKSNAVDFAEEFIGRLQGCSIGKLYVLRGNLAELALERSLSQAGYGIESKVVYETRARNPSQSDCEALVSFLEQGVVERRGFIVFHSEGIRALHRLVAECKVPRTIVAENIFVVGPKTAQTAEEKGFQSIIVSPRPSTEDLIEILPF